MLFRWANLLQLWYIQSMKSTFKTTTPKETIQLGMQLATRLMPGSTVLLFGDLGSGKTHFTKGIAEGLGIQEMIKSPTFTYVNSYELRVTNYELKLFHYDLYRLNQGEGLESIGLFDTIHDPDTINIIEWADRMEGYEPKDYIRIDFIAKDDHHEITIQFQDSRIVPEELVDKFWADWVTPLHVRDHCRQVSKVAVQIGEEMSKKNIIINLDLLNTAGLLHDMARVCDFRQLDRNKFQEEVTDEKWARWVDLRKQFEGMHHADIACGALLEEGFNKTAQIIRLHNSLSILEEPEKFSYLEIAILYYADKRVKHNEIVDLKERFRDGRERNGEDDYEETRQKFEQVEKETFELERQLFELIDLKPEDIN